MSINWNDFLRNAAEFIGVALLAAVSFSLKRWKDTWTERKARKFDLSINRNAKVQALLSELRPVMDADRVELFQLHNGEYFLSGESQLKTSLTHFYVRTGIAMPLFEQNQNVPTSHFSNLFKCMRDHGACHVPHQTHEEMDAAFRRMLNIAGARMAFIVPVMKKKDVWIGFLVISRLTDDETLQDHQKAQAIDYAQQIADQLSLP